MLELAILKDIGQLKIKLENLSTHIQFRTETGSINKRIKNELLPLLQERNQLYQYSEQKMAFIRCDKRAAFLQ